MTASDRRVSPTITLAVLSLGAIAYGVLSAVVIPALPRLQRDLHTSENGVAWLLTAYLLAASVGTSILGRLGDMFGKKRMLVWTLGILAAGTLMAAVTDSLALLIIARVFQGAAGGIFPLSFAIIRDDSHARRWPGIGILSATIGVGGGLGTVGPV